MYKPGIIPLLIGSVLAVKFSLVLKPLFDFTSILFVYFRSVHVYKNIENHHGAV